MTERGREVATKLRTVRDALAAGGLAAARFRGVDWFSWLTAGGSSVVILTAEEGVAEVLVTRERAWVLTNAIEADRIREEELPPGLELWAGPWAEPARLDALVREEAGGAIASDRPRAGEQPLPPALVEAKRRLLPPELGRYREIGAQAASAMTEALRAARPEWTELELAGEGARALWRRGLHPTLTLAAGEERVERHRHPVPTRARLGRRAMLVFCARGHGLYANLTRFVSFEKPGASEERRLRELALIEGAAWNASRPGTSLSEAYRRIVEAYALHGHAGQHLKHHQGGTTGYLSREIVASPSSVETVAALTALAWNPSLPGLKLEDTIVVAADGSIETLTLDPEWPVFSSEGRVRPEPLVRP